MLYLKTLSFFSFFTFLFMVNSTDPVGVNGPCPDGTDYVAYSCGGDACVGFPVAWTDAEKEIWVAIADNIRCSNETITIAPR